MAAEGAEVGYDKSGKAFAKFKTGTRFCMPISHCEEEDLTDIRGRGAPQRIMGLLFILSLCGAACAQKCYFQRKVKLLRDALNSDHSQEMAGGATGDQRWQNYVV